MRTCNCITGTRNTGLLEVSPSIEERELLTRANVAASRKRDDMAFSQVDSPRVHIRVAVSVDEASPAA